jgi:adenylate cyclase class IV
MVEKVGQFVELEIKVDSAAPDKEKIKSAEIEAARRILARLADELELRNSERRSYLELLLASAR